MSCSTLDDTSAACDPLFLFDHFNEFLTKTGGSLTPTQKGLKRCSRRNVNTCVGTAFGIGEPEL
jgi:hypothetical protein